MCELNYKGTKIKIRVKLWDQKYNFTYKNEAFTGNHSDIDTWHWHVTVTRDRQRLKLTVNIQIGLPRPILQKFIKLENQICKLNYRGTKSKIEDKLED